MKKHVLQWMLMAMCCLFPASLMAGEKSCSKQLAAMLVTFLDQEEVHPDSVFTNIRRMEQRLTVTTNPTERAMTWAVLGYLYNSRSRYSQTTRNRVGTDTVNDSLPDLQRMDAWSWNDYQKRGVFCFRQALSDLDLLHKAKTKSWAPLLSKGKNDKLFGASMLYPIWKTAREVQSARQNELPGYKDLIGFYTQKGNRQASLLLSLDSLNTVGQTTRMRALEQLKETYADMDLCAEVYLSMSRTADSDSLKAAILRQGIARYPKYKRIGELKNDLRQLQSPRLDCHTTAWSATAYPGDTLSMTFSLRNVQSLEYAIYRVNQSFPFDSLQTLDNREQWALLNACGTRVEQHSRHYAPLATEETSFRDSIAWQTTEVGLYIMAVRALTTWSHATEREAVHFTPFRITRLSLIEEHLPDKRLRFIAVDSRSGKPLKGACIGLYTRKDWQDSQRHTPFTRLTTDARGMAETATDVLQNKTVYATLWMAGDTIFPDYRLYTSRGRLSYDEEADTARSIGVYTDRGIYRPGQTIHVAGLMSRRHVWDESVLPHQKLSIELWGADHKKISSSDVVSDEMGSFTTDFVIPEGALPGVFSIRLKGAANTYVRVEEYKQPTFEVTMDDSPALQLPADSITLTGRATTYSGVAVRGSRVTGSYQWRRPYWCWWWKRDVSYNESRMHLDTLTTDQDGRFAIRVPLSFADDLRYGMNLEVDVDVLSPTGETQTGTAHVHLCSKALRLRTSIPREVDKDCIKPWSIELVTSTGQTTAGLVDIRLTRNGLTALSSRQEAGSSILPAGIESLPSGRYQVMLTAIEKGDTASWKQDILLYSLADEALPVDTCLWVKLGDEYFDTDHPARVQIGSSLGDAFIYCSLTSNNEVVLDEAPLALNQKGMKLLTIPYEERFGEGLTLSVIMVRDGTTYKQTRSLLKRLPEKELKHRWVTFRNKLQPGQKETWRLQLTRPDGTPANAQLMATLYDASLDALNRTPWSISHNLHHNICSYEHSLLRSSLPSLYSNTYFGHRSINVADYTFSHLNSELFEPRFRMMSFGGKRNVRIRGRASSTNYVVAEAAPMFKSVAMDLAAAKDVDAEASSTGLKEVQVNAKGTESDAETADGEKEPVVKMRSDFSETAAFLPQLMSDDKGIVTLQFTLPESMTTWRLQALAHTADMLTTLIGEDVVAQKDLMAQLSLPRFVRSGDQAELVATLNNLLAEPQSGRGYFVLLDARTEKELIRRKVDFALKGHADTTFCFPIEVGEEADMLIVRWSAESQKCSDGEQRYLPVLSDKVYVTDTRALTFYGKGEYKEDLSTLFPTKNVSKKRLTVDYVSNPAWLAVESLPTLSWPQNNDVLSLATAYYSDEISRYIAESRKLSFDKLRNQAESRKLKAESGLAETSQLSPLTSHLSPLTSPSTPWVEDAEREAKRKERLASLFDPATQESLLKAHLDKIRNLQQKDGSFAWYQGMRGSHYLTLEVAYLLTRQKLLTGKAPKDVLGDAVKFLRTKHPRTLCNSTLRYLYVVSNNSEGTTKADRQNADSLVKALSKIDLEGHKWQESLSIEDCALAAIVLQNYGKQKAARKFVDVVKKYLVTTDDKGTYIEHLRGTFTSIDRRMHIHVQIMEALNAVSPKDSVLLRGMQRYLLNQKRTQCWDTPVTTANAVYALLLKKDSVLSQEAKDVVKVKLADGKTQTLRVEDKTIGSIHCTMDVEKNPSQLVVSKKQTDESWGAVYAQYLQPMADVAAKSEGLSVTREYSLKELRVGDHIHVRYVVTADRDFEYVRLTVPRPAACEPMNALSGYQWQNGIGSYRAVHDDKTEYFFDQMPRGTYVIEEDMTVERNGTYQCGIATVECVYASEYSGHTEGHNLKVD